MTRTATTATTDENDPKKKRGRANVIAIPRMRRDLLAQIDAAHESLPRGEFTLGMFTEKIEDILRSVDFDKYLPEAAMLLAKAEDHRRTSPLFNDDKDGTDEMFGQEYADSTWIALGSGKRVRFSDATFSHMQVKAMHQSKHAKESAESSYKYQRKMTHVAPIMGRDPDCTYEEAMYRLGDWKRP